MAEDSLMLVLRYLLSDYPIVETIEVYVDGALAIGGWSYDPYENAVIFDIDHVPAADSIITIDYGVYGECP